MTTRRTVLKGALAGAATSSLAFPFISYGQSDVIRIGHLTPRTGFLGPLGEFAVQAADMAVAEINAAGGINGRKIELLKEDSVNPQTATTKAERMIERDKVACIIGEISSASALAIGQVASRTKTLFKVLIPATLPYMFTGFRLSLGIAWLVIVAAEMLTGRPGVGGFLWQEYNSLIYEHIILCILTIGIVGFILDRLMSLVERRFKTA